MSDEILDRVLTLELVRVTERAAVAASYLVGRGNEKDADQAAVDAMRKELNQLNIDGEVVKDNSTYLLKDNTSLNNLVVSSTTLHPGKSTRGHSHPGKEEVYMIMSGTGRMQLDDNEFDISGGEMVLIEDGVFHRVHNTGDIDLYMVCIFDGIRENVYKT